MREFQQRGRTMFFVSHAAEAVREMCRRALVIEHGRILFDGDAEAGIRAYRGVLAASPQAVELEPAEQPEPEPIAEIDVDAWHRRIVGGLWEEGGQRHVAFLREQGIKPSDRVLDIGCGCLRTGVPLMKFLKPGRYVGIDLDPTLIEAGVTIELPRARIDRERGQYLVGNATDLSAVDGVFDVIWVNGLVQQLPHEQVALTLMAAIRHLGPGGRLFVSYFEAPLFLALDPIERPGPCFSYFDSIPRHFDFATLARYTAAAGGHAERFGAWGDPHGQMMMIVTGT
jgi:SAM-dependent methyltransferase